MNGCGRNDLVNRNAGNDGISGGQGNNAVGGDGDDNVKGGAGNDIIFGNAGIDWRGPTKSTTTPVIQLKPTFFYFIFFSVNKFSLFLI